MNKKSLLVGAAIGIVIGLFGGHWLDWFFRSVSFTVLVLSLVALWLPVIAVHEVGHLAGGWICGNRFLLFAIGPIALRRVDGRLRWSINKWNAIGGLSASVPVGDSNVRWKTLCVLSCGPLASLVGGVLCIVAIQQWGTHFSVSVSIPLRIAAFFNLMVGITNLIPSPSGRSDGSRILMLLRGTAAGQRWCAVNALGGLDQAGVRPRDWPSGWVGALTVDLDNTIDSVGALLYAHLFACDTQDCQAASEWIDKAMAIDTPMPPLLKAGVILSCATFEASVRRNPIRGRELFMTVAPTPGEPASMRPFVEAVLCASEGRFPEARQFAASASALMPNPPVFGRDKMARDQITELLERVSAAEGSVMK